MADAWGGAFGGAWGAAWGAGASTEPPPTTPSTQGFVGYSHKELRKHGQRWRELKRKKKRDRRNDLLRILLLLESI